MRKQGHMENCIKIVICIFLIYDSLEACDGETVLLSLPIGGEGSSKMRFQTTWHMASFQVAFLMSKSGWHTC